MGRPVLIIGGGLSGLAAALRLARFDRRVVVVERHTRPGGLNSWFYRNNTLFETGLHAITNYAAPGDRRAPLNRLLRQLKVKRSELRLCQQVGSRIVFEGCETVKFSNNFSLLEAEISEKFPKSADGFQALLRFVNSFDAFAPAPFRSSRAFLDRTLSDPLLIEMLLCPLMYYGSSHEEDIDLAQFVIMFRAIFVEGMFRPEGSIKDLIELLQRHIREYGGEIRTGCGVTRLYQKADSAIAELDSGEEIECTSVLSTIGAEETRALINSEKVPVKSEQERVRRLSFVENIFQLPTESVPEKTADTTIIFFNRGEKFHYRRPQQLIDTTSGVICFPAHFTGIPPRPRVEIRTTHLASVRRWEEVDQVPATCRQAKRDSAERSLRTAERLIGDFADAVTFTDTFTPLTIKRYTGKIDGAIYGSPEKIKDGNLGYANIFLAGTDQGFLGIVGSMLSGVSIVNQHILPRL